MNGRTSKCLSGRIFRHRANLRLAIIDGLDSLSLETGNAKKRTKEDSLLDITRTMTVSFRYS